MIKSAWICFLTFCEGFRLGKMCSIKSSSDEKFNIRSPYNYTYHRRHTLSRLLFMHLSQKEREEKKLTLSGAEKGERREVLRRNELNYRSIGPRGLPKLFSLSLFLSSVSRQRGKSIAHVHTHTHERLSARNFFYLITVYVYYIRKTLR